MGKGTRLRLHAAEAVEDVNKTSMPSTGLFTTGGQRLVYG